MAYGSFFSYERSWRLRCGTITPKTTVATDVHKKIVGDGELFGIIRANRSKDENGPQLLAKIMAEDSSFV